jgi:hypothetical protein
MEHVPQHASSFNFQFRVSYWGALVPKDLSHKTLIVPLMHWNIDGPIEIKEVNIKNDGVVAHLNQDTREKIRQVLNKSADCSLRRISVSFQSGKNDR